MACPRRSRARRIPDPQSGQPGLADDRDERVAKRPRSGLVDVGFPARQAARWHTSLVSTSYMAVLLPASRTTSAARLIGAGGFEAGMGGPDRTTDADSVSFDTFLRGLATKYGQ